MWGVLAGVIVFAALAVLLGYRHVEVERARTCVQDVKLIGAALLVYAADHDSRLPPVTVYPEGIVSYPIPVYFPTRGQRPLPREAFICPSDPQRAMPGYAYNPIWAGQSLSDIPAPATNVLLYEASDGQLVFRHRWEAWGGPGERTNVTYCDGHVQSLSPRFFDTRDVQNKTGSPIERWPIPAP